MDKSIVGQQDVLRELYFALVVLYGRLKIQCYCNGGL